MNPQHPLQRAYYQSQPHILLTINGPELDGSIEAETIADARELRRALIPAFFQVSAGIRAEKRRQRQERRDTRDLARVSAYAKGAARG